MRALAIAATISAGRYGEALALPQSPPGNRPTWSSSKEARRAWSLALERDAESESARAAAQRLSGAPPPA